ncbi:pyruvate, water dikinase regulatory protein [Enterorhabdus sp. P55]|uniref:pyruvate, water dikinase regulatory protein n=1 Tax=Enterorhabdus sp. P55 TaxID=2304571 RepID=UPI001371DD25|nr:pyruvate, water dikinase regulatory protein [Enterorhabdus sp. P55]MCI8451939.1 kinase/pyrophosphorylase [Eggerthellaceae bacterium]NBI32605.1 kinase/pyrophosphorylase [Enterorhabdus sp. P55]
MDSHSPQERAARVPTIHVISDSVGVTAQAVARAAAAQFGVNDPKIEVLPKVQSFEQVRSFLDEHAAYHVHTLGDDRLLVFFTLVDRAMSEQTAAYIAEHDNILGVDIMTGAIEAISELSGLRPTSRPGSLREANEVYFRRIEAIEFTIAHDDGRNPQDLALADMVLLGVSRSSKTPLSIYLSQQGYKVANVPLDPSTEPPSQIYEVDRTRLFGLMTTADVLTDIRQRRLGNAALVAASYADPEYIYEDLEKARALMRKLGCIVIHTEKRAVEETAQEILRYYERSHPSATDIIE